MDSDHLQVVLKKLGWTDGFQIPIANEENKVLEEEVAKLSLRRFQTKNAYETAVSRRDALKNHLKFIKQEHEQTQKFIIAHKQQLDKESNALKLAQTEKSRIELEIKQTSKNLQDVRETNQQKKNDIQKNMSKIEAMKRETFWDEEALSAWEEALKKRDDDNELLKKFSREDEKKFLELEGKRALLQTEYLVRQQTVAKMVNDVTNYETVLERTGKTIKQQITEREALIKQWKDTIKILHQRDNDINRAQMNVMEVIRLINGEKENLDNENRLLKIEINSNKEIERQLADLNAQHSRTSKEVASIVQYVLILNSESNSLKRQMTTTAHSLEEKRCTKKTLSKELEKKEAEIESSEYRLRKLNQKLEHLQQTNTSAQERLKQLETLVEFEEKQHTIFLRDSDRFSGLIFRTQTKMQEQLDITKTKEVCITNIMTNIEHLQKSNKEYSMSAVKKKELIYNMEFKIDQMEEKIMKMEKQIFEDSDEEELSVKLTELERCYQEHIETRNLLQDQTIRIQDEMRRLTVTMSNDEQHLRELTDKLQTQKLLYEGGMKQATVARAETQDKQVEENILLLRLNQFENYKKKEENNIYHLQKLRLNLEQAMREREVEIRTNKELLLSKKRSLEEDKGRLKSDLNARELKSDQIQKKYQIVLMSLGRDADGQPLSVGYYRLKAAQDKYMLKQHGDDLDDKVKKIELEIVAMENTLNVVNLTNLAFKKTLSAVDDQGIEMSRMQELQTRHAELVDKLRLLKNQLASDKQEISDIDKEMENVEEQRKTFQEALDDLEKDYSKMQKDCDEKQEKLKRTMNLLKKFEKKLSHETMEAYDRDLEIRQLIDSNKQGLQRMTELGIKYIEIMPALKNYASQYEIRLPDISATQISKIRSTPSITEPGSSSIIDTRSTSSLEDAAPSRASICSITKGSCHCSSSSSNDTSRSITSVVLTFDGK